VNFQVFTPFHEIFILPVWAANNAKNKIASHGIFHKKSYIFPLRGGKMDCLEYERFFVKKPMRGYFSRCLAFIPVKKKISLKIKV
jgi:hypothetical protein